MYEVMEAKVRLAQTVLHLNPTIPTDVVVERLETLWAWCTKPTPAPERNTTPFG